MQTRIDHQKHVADIVLSKLDLGESTPITDIRAWLLSLGD